MITPPNIWGLDETKLNDNMAFVYKLTFKDGTYYIGAKKLWIGLAKAPSTFKRKKVFRPSNWREYNSSSTQVKQLINTGEKPKREVIGLYPTWGKALYAETATLIKGDHLNNPKCLNKAIQVRLGRTSYTETQGE